MSATLLNTDRVIGTGPVAATVPAESARRDAVVLRSSVEAEIIPLRPTEQDGVPPLPVDPRLVAEILSERRTHRYPPQLAQRAIRWSERVLATLFPHFSASIIEATERSVLSDLAATESGLIELLHRLPGAPLDVRHIANLFTHSLASIRSTLAEDAQAIVDGDPAADDRDAVILYYPGFFAIAVHRIAHQLQVLQVPLIPRLLAEHAHARTGIDLHPGAVIGARFCIDHGTGVVVGETSVIGRGVKLYQGVTLGALTVDKALAGRRRHPTLEDGVVVYAGATILGGDTVVGRGSIVAGNAFVTRSVPRDSLVDRAGRHRPLTVPHEDVIDFVI